MELTPKNELRSGDVGYIISGVKKANEVKVGDTITSLLDPCGERSRGRRRDRDRGRGRGREKEKERERDTERER